MLNRRHFLQISALSATGSMAGCATSRSRESQARAARLGDGAPHRIIHVVSDGMSLGTLSCADQLSRHETGNSLAWIELLNDPRCRTGLMDMRSLDSLVTDSAAASSSWGSGSRVRNGVLNVSSKGTRLVPLMQLFGEAGWHRGLVTTTEITHATPAGFTVAVESRGDGEEIASQYLERGLDLLLGGARNHFNPGKRKDKKDLPAEFAARGYQVLNSRSDLLSAPVDARWLGTFAEGHLPYTLDQVRDPGLAGTVPTLAEMTRRALEKLGRHEHFLLQIEGGRVDHACHNNDAAAALRDQQAVDEALRLAIAFQREHPETLLVVTTDHGNANLGLNGMGTSYRDSSLTFRRVAEIRASFPEILKRLKTADTDAEAREVLADATGWKVEARRLAQLRPYVAGQGGALFDQMNSDVAALGQLMANHLGIGFVGTSHTSDYVPILAVGPGAERFRGMIRNTDVFRHYTGLAGIDFRNPEEPLLAHMAGTGNAEDCGSYALA